MPNNYDSFEANGFVILVCSIAKLSLCYITYIYLVKQQQQQQLSSYNAAAAAAVEINLLRYICWPYNFGHNDNFGNENRRDVGTRRYER